MSNKVKKVNLAEPGPSCTVLQNGETSGLCNGKEEEANRQWKGLPLRTEFPVFWEFLGIPRNSKKFPIMQMTLAN